jgi:glycosyltransferase involved in cell wall biosynthesis
MYAKNKVGVIIAPQMDPAVLPHTLSILPACVDRIYLLNGYKPLIPSHPDLVAIDVKDAHCEAALSYGFKKALEDGMGVVCVIGAQDGLSNLSLEQVLNSIIQKRTKYARIEQMPSTLAERASEAKNSSSHYLVSSGTSCPQFTYLDLINGITAIDAPAARHLAELLSHKGMRVLAAIPCYNEELAIGSVIIKARRYVDEVLVVNDDSTDDTARIASDTGSTVINHPERIGIAKALLTAIEYAQIHEYDILVFLDCSGQYDPDQIPNLIDPVIEGKADVVIGSRNYPRRSSIPPYSLDENHSNSGVTFRSTDPCSPFRALSKKAFIQCSSSDSSGDLMVAMLSSLSQSNFVIQDIASGDNGVLVEDMRENIVPLYRENKIGVVVPAYNEELLIGDTLTTIPNFVCRLYVVNDCSTDRTREIINYYAQHDSTIIPIHHEKNLGVGASIISGYKAALSEGIDVVAVMAGDNQMDPAFLSHLLDPIIDGKVDYTVGNRLISPVYRKGMTPWRFFGNTILTMLTKIASGYWQLVDPQNGFTAISKRALERLDLDSVYPRYGYCNDLLVKLNILGFRMKNVPHPARYGREKSGIKYSTYIVGVSRLLWHDFLERLKTKYILLSFHPLAFFYLAGLILILLGLLGGGVTLWEKFVMGSSVLFVHGILSLIVFTLGIMFLFFAMLFDMQQEKNSNGWY